MKAKYFRKIRRKVKWYKVSYRDTLFSYSSFCNEKTVLARSPEEACARYHKRTSCFMNSIDGDVRQLPEDFSRFKVCIGEKTMYFD